MGSSNPSYSSQNAPSSDITQQTRASRVSGLSPCRVGLLSGAGYHYRRIVGRFYDGVGSGKWKSDLGGYSSP